MTFSNSTWRFVALLMGYGTLTGCGGREAPPPNPIEGPKPQAAEIKPRFTIDCGLMDVWDMKKTGPIFMSVSPNGKLLMTMSQSSRENVQVWDLSTQTKVHAIRNDIGTMNAPIAVAADSKAAAYVQFRPTGAVVLFDLSSGKQTRTIEDRRITSFVRGLHFSPDGSLIVLGCKQEIVCWETATGKQKFSWQEPSTVRALSPFFANGSKIGCLNGSGGIDIWDVAAGRRINTFSAGGDPKFVAALAITPDPKTLISRANGPFKIWDLPAGKLRKEFTEQFGTFAHIVPLADKRTVAWTTNDGFILYDLETASKKQQLKAHELYVTSLAATPDGRTLLTAGTDSTIKGWSLTANGLVE